MGGFWEGKTEDSFEKENEPEKYTQKWAQNWDEDKRKSEIELHCKNEIENLPFFKKKFTNAKIEFTKMAKESLKKKKELRKPF